MQLCFRVQSATRNAHFFPTVPFSDFSWWLLVSLWLFDLSIASILRAVRNWAPVTACFWHNFERIVSLTSHHTFTVMEGGFYMNTMSQRSCLLPLGGRDGLCRILRFSPVKVKDCGSSMTKTMPIADLRGKLWKITWWTILLERFRMIFLDWQSSLRYYPIRPPELQQPYPAGKELNRSLAPRSGSMGHCLIDIWYGQLCLHDTHELWVFSRQKFSYCLQQMHLFIWALMPGILEQLRFRSHEVHPTSSNFIHWISPGPIPASIGLGQGFGEPMIWVEIQCTRRPESNAQGPWGSHNGNVSRWPGHDPVG